jgi:hypothetical protein
MPRRRKEKMTLGERLAAWERGGRAKDERDVKSGRITEEQVFEKNFFFHGIDFSKAKIIRKPSRRAARPKKF